MTAEEIRGALGHFATGVTVMSIRDDSGRAIGVTANSFTSVSLEPPLILWCLRCRAAVHPVFAGNELFAVNFLDAISEASSINYARRGQNIISDDELTLSKRGVPLMKSALSSLECKTIRRDDGGDHSIFLAQILEIHEGRRGEPLVFYKGGYRQLAKE